MKKLNRYFKSLLFQGAVTFVVLSVIAINDLIHGSQASWILPAMKSAYVELSRELYRFIFKPEMTPDLLSLIDFYGFYVRIGLSFLIASISIWRRYRYAVVIEGAVTLLSLLLFVFRVLFA